MDHPFDLLRHLILFALLVSALYLELVQGNVGNVLTYGGILAGLLLSLPSGWGRGVADCLRNPGEPGLMNALLGAGVAFAVFAPFCWAGGFMAGDLKLMTAVGVLTGLRTTLTALVLVSATGAAMAVGLLIWKGRFVEGLKGSWEILRRLGRPATLPLAGAPLPAARLSIPYAVAIAVGTTWAWYLHYV